MPDEIFSLYERVTKLDSAIQRDKDDTIKMIISRDEYEQTLVEYGDIICAADRFLASKVRALDLTRVSEEIARQKKFFVNLAHCLQVLATLEEQFSPQVRYHKVGHVFMNYFPGSRTLQGAAYCPSCPQPDHPGKMFRSHKCPGRSLC